MSDKSREKFEAWCELTCRNTAKCLSGDEYQLDQTEADWEAWQASRAAGVSLPPVEYFGDSWSGGWAIGRQDLVDSLEEQGFTVEDDQ